MPAATTQPTVYTISGFVYDEYNSPVSNTAVKLFDINLRSEKQLGQIKTDDIGFYTINFNAIEAEKPNSFRLQLRIYNKQNKLLGQSPLYFNVQPEMAIDYKVGSTELPGINEFDLLVNRIDTIIKPLELKLGNLEENDTNKDISFIAGKTGQDFQKISFVNDAFAFGKKTKLSPDIFYGLFRLGHPANLDDILTTKAQSLKRSLNKAMAENIISGKREKELPTITKSINDLSAGSIVDKEDEQSVNFKKLFKSVLTPAQQKTFASVYFDTENEPEKFWGQLKQQQGFTDGKIKKIKGLLILSHLTGGTGSLSSLLFSESEADIESKSLRFFSKFSIDDWRSRIEQLVSKKELTQFPDGIEGNTAEEKTANYAEALYNLLNKLYPTDVFAERMKADSVDPFGEGKRDLETFLDTNYNFDLKTNRLKKEFNESNFEGVKKKEELKQAIRKINRLYKLTDRYASIAALLKAGIDSSAAIIKNYTKAEFGESFESAMDKEEADKIYRAARRMDKKATSIALNYKMKNNLSVFCINGENASSPDYQSMFNDNKLCDCDHCQSVYSPSAYLVDILSFLRQNDRQAFKELKRRRPDIVKILLTCNNTNTPLPYIDLVNELLEDSIAGGIEAHQTTKTGEELIAYPEHINSDANALLKTAGSYYTLPFDYELEETRLCIEKLSINRSELMALFYTQDANEKYANVMVATEYLNISNAELQILNGSAGDADIEMKEVLLFLEKTGLTYIELLQVLECTFINPINASGDRKIKIISSDPGDPNSCDVDKMVFSGVGSTGKKITRFIRLWKKTGLDLYDLDRIFNAFEITDFDAGIDEKLIIPLSNVIRIKEKFRLSIPEILSFWSPVSVAVYRDAKKVQFPLPSLYENLFLNKKVSNPVDADMLDPLALHGNLADKSSLLAGVLNLSQKDLEKLSSQPFTDGKLNLANLSVLYRYSLLSKALQLSMDELIMAIELTLVNPFGERGKTENLLILIDKIELIRTSGFTIVELNNILGGPATNTTVIDPNKTAGTLTALREGLQKINLLDPIGLTPEETEKNKKANQLNLISETLSLAFNSEPAIVMVVVNDLVRSAVNDTDPAFTAFTDTTFIESAGPLYQTNESGDVVWQFPDLIKTYDALYLTAKRLLILLTKLKISADEFTYFQKHEAVLSLDGIWVLPTSNSDASLFSSFENLYELVYFRNSLKIRQQNWYNLFDDAISNQAGAKLNFINCLSTLINVPADTVEFLTGPANNVDVKGRLNLDFPAGYLKAKSLLHIMNCVSLSTKTGSSPENLFILMNDAKLAKDTLKSRYDEAAWLKIIEPISKNLRKKKRNALLSYILTSPALDTFRSGNSITDTNSLFAYFLIDIEMDPCMLSSRIKQAISAVQLFIDRCLLNLEKEIHIDEDFETQWHQWRKSYRIWEANRKIFLYPENWIEPELRDDKSSFFKEFESKLKQNEITDDTVQSALLEYLGKLDAVANLEIVGQFEEKDRAIVHVIGRTNSVPHQYYYIRQADSVWSGWEKIDLDIEGDHILPVTWNGRLLLIWGILQEKEVKKPGGTKVPEQGETIPSPEMYTEAKLAWSEYKNGYWTSKKISEDVLPVRSRTIAIQDRTDGAGTTPTTYITNDSIRACSLSSSIEGGRLRIHVCTWEEPANYLVNSYVDYEFSFQFCNGSPVLTKKSSGIYAKGPQGTFGRKMFITESESEDKEFTGYKNGVLVPPGGTGIPIFKKLSRRYKLLPNFHNLMDQENSSFFYSSQQKHFFVQISEVVKQDVLSDNLGVPGDILIARKVIDPVPEEYSNIFTAITRSVLPDTLPGEDLPQKKASTNFKAFPFFARKEFRFQSFYHPYVCSFIKKLNISGIDALYKENVQNKIAEKIFTDEDYNPTANVSRPYPVEKIDFDLNGVYSIYNWELFFHIPLLIATRLSQNQRFEEARKWFHYIFNPVKSSAETGLDAYWITAPFKKEILTAAIPIDDFINDPENEKDLKAQLDNWASHPFNPHSVARLRIAAYMRTTVMKYIDNIVDWGDQLFQRDTIETINEATQLYVLAANLLGKKPPQVPARNNSGEYSFSNIKDRLDGMNNAKVKIESLLLAPAENEGNTSDDDVLMPMFCTPKNEQLLSYWDTIADRLFKIRHCMNIQGVVRQLPLFEPPIDPSLLVRANAAGIDLNSVLNDLNTTLPNYRFQVMLQKANELVNDIKSLGNSLLSALEKKDGEELALLRSTHELNMLDRIKDVKEMQRNETKENLDSLLNSRKVVEQRKIYYDNKEFMNVSEKLHVASMGAAGIFQGLASGIEAYSGLLSATPDTMIGPFSSGFTIGGSYFAAAAHANATIFGIYANAANTTGAIAASVGSFQQRMDDWKFQAASAELELKQIDKQIIAAEIRLAIAEKEIENHILQMEQSKEVDDYMRGKFTNAELYDWMIGQVSTVYFQSYQLAYSTAKKAEKCMQHELGLEATNYIQFGYWDSLKKGLLSGDKLQYDLRRLENAYLEENKRELEITKHISLALIDPLQVQELTQTGKCNINLREELFDLDFPGHYFRRIKAMSISIPCVAGPYVSVNATLRLVSNECRVNGDATVDYQKTQDEMDNAGTGRFRSNRTTITSIATSSGQHDTGMFELNFRDERYLPFEGCGAVSSWTLELNDEFRQFDYSTISDIILHLQYTARENTALKDKALVNLREYFAIAENRAALLPRAFSLKRNFPDAFHQLRSTTTPKTSIEITEQQFSFLFRNTGNPVNKARVFILPKERGVLQQPEFFSINGKPFNTWSPFNETAIIVSEEDIEAGSFTFHFTMEITGSGGCFNNVSENIGDIIVVLE